MTTKEPHALEAIYKAQTALTSYGDSDIALDLNIALETLRQYMAQPTGGIRPSKNAEFDSQADLTTQNDKLTDAQQEKFVLENCRKRWKLSDYEKKLVLDLIKQALNLSPTADYSAIFAVQESISRPTDAEKQAALDELNRIFHYEVPHWVSIYHEPKLSDKSMHTIRAALQTPAQPVNQMLLDALILLRDKMEEEQKIGVGGFDDWLKIANSAITAAEAISKTETVELIDGLGEAIDACQMTAADTAVNKTEWCLCFGDSFKNAGRVLEAARRYHNIMKKEG